METTMRKDSSRISNQSPAHAGNHRQRAARLFHVPAANKVGVQALNVQMLANLLLIAKNLHDFRV